jgi:hypothetical protein
MLVSCGDVLEDECRVVTIAEKGFVREIPDWSDVKLTPWREDALRRWQVPRTRTSYSYSRWKSRFLQRSFRLRSIHDDDMLAPSVILGGVAE